MRYRIATAALFALLSTASAQTPNGWSGFIGTVGTPLSVSTSSATATLPSGSVVIATNVGGNIAYCQLAATATTSAVPIAANGGFFPFIPGGNTQLSCITSSGTTTVNLVGGGPSISGRGGAGGGSGTGTTPGGATTDVQFNNAGVFSGDSGFTYAGSGGLLAVGGNNSGGTAIELVNTSSSAKSWELISNGTSFAPGFLAFFDSTQGTNEPFAINETGVTIPTGFVYGWSQSTTQAPSNAFVTGFSKIGTPIVALGNGTNGDTSGLLVTNTVQSVADSSVGSTQTFSNTTLTTFGLTTGSVNLSAGKIYAIDLDIDSTANGTSGLQGDFNGGTATATSLAGTCYQYVTSGTAPSFNKLSGTSLTQNWVNLGTAVLAVHCSLNLTVNAAGTFVPRAALFTGTTAGTINVGSRMTVRQLSH